MGSFQIIILFVSTLLVLIAIISGSCLLKLSWPKGIAGVVQEAKNGLNRGYKFLGCTKISGSKGTETISWEDGFCQNNENQPAFTDSWENVLWSNEENQSAFTDRDFH
jgi:hypothetical protein